MIVAIFIINNLRVGVKFFKEQMKQDNIVYLFSQNDAIRNGQVFTFEETSLCSILSRHYRFYETSGFAWRAFGTRDHLIVYPENAQYIDLYCENKGAGDAKIGDITHRTLDGSIMYKCLIKKADVIKCMLLQLFNPRSYNETVKKLGEIYVLPVGEQTKTK